MVLHTEMRGRVVKERLKGKDSLGEKKAQSVRQKKNRELLREGGRIQRDAEIKRIKEERESMIKAGER